MGRGSPLSVESKKLTAIKNTMNKLSHVSPIFSKRHVEHLTPLPPILITASKTPANHEEWKYLQNTIIYIMEYIILM